MICSITTKNKLDAHNLIEITKKANTNKSIQFDKILFNQSKMGFVSGNKPNPFESIYFYDSKNPNEIAGTIETFHRPLPVLSSSGTHQEYVTIFFYEDKNEVEVIENLRHLFSTFIKYN